LLLFPLLDLTNLPFPCKWELVIEDIVIFNHLQFQDTRMYLLKPVGLVKVFATLHSSCDCVLLWDWSISKRNSRHMLPHTHIEVFSRL